MKKVLIVIGAFGFLTALNGCDSGGGSRSSYISNLKPIDPASKIAKPAGVATFESKGSMIEMSLDADGLAPNSPQAYMIRELPRCPTLADDTNGDGIVDAVEEEAIARAADGASNDDLVKALPNAGRDGSLVANDMIPMYDSGSDGQKNFVRTLKGHVFVLHGVPSTTSVPATVRTVGDLPVYATIPTACGPIEEVALNDASTNPAPTGANPSPTPAQDTTKKDTTTKQGAGKQDQAQMPLPSPTPGQDQTKQSPPLPTPTPSQDTTKQSPPTTKQDTTKQSPAKDSKTSATPAPTTKK